MAAANPSPLLQHPRHAALQRKLAEAQSAEAGAVDTAMVAVFDAKDRIIERANAEAARIREQAEMEIGAKKSDAERMLLAAQSESAGLRQALAEGDEAGVAAARVAAAEAEAERIIAAAQSKAAGIQAPDPAAVEELTSKISLLESDLEVAKFEAVKLRTERDRLNSAAVAEAKETVAALLADASQQAQRLKADAEAQIEASRAAFRKETETERGSLQAQLDLAKAELAQVKESMSQTSEEQATTQPASATKRRSGLPNW